MAVTARSGNRSWFTIQDVSRRSGLSEPTLRYYEKIGLIGPVPRDPSSGHRRYDAGSLETIEALSCLRSTGVGVEDMRAYLSHLAREDEAATEMRDLFLRHAERVADEIERMRVRLRYLRHKAELWDARSRGDAEAESRAIAEIVRAIGEF
ncbi:MerR family transcriptional regulator [Sphaerisporangium sp. NPDC005288]|uniref:MerR family transcriptional regulator n=1 Tax=Sphaerisporangium sp. NPDC005288 TaxID=3155114 RepID=UPI0033A8C4A1